MQWLKEKIFYDSLSSSLKNEIAITWMIATKEYSIFWH
jgi:hypothetical protein